ncbi:L,D-transpeptidase family protein [Streptomyces sp. NRRL S-920]|uniref:L,D-transpeptidase family protein n=1 Tax=Streptomyces sp. NRRL S-920 TaxID=1463921 RepID=UPI0009977B53|nr:L,D-transpeptidase family protein [Streptomyces sp. NRRL S-920]
MGRSVAARGVAGRGALSVGAVAVLALVAGCKAVAVDTEGGRPGEEGAAGRTAAGGTADGIGKPPAPAAPGAAPAPRTLMREGERGGQVRELQARLRQIAWFFEYPSGTYGASTVSAVEGFQAKRGLPRTGRTDTVTWQRLLAMTREPTRDELYAGGGMPPAAPDKRCLTGRVLCLAKSSRTLTWMVDGKAVSTMDVRFGSQYTPTREGTFRVYWKSRHHVSTLYDTPMPYAMFFSGGQAVHYSADFAARGYAGGSHGCVNVRDERKIAHLFAQVRKGDRVVIYK